MRRVCDGLQALLRDQKILRDCGAVSKNTLGVHRAVRVSAAEPRHPASWVQNPNVELHFKILLIEQLALYETGLCETRP